MEIFSIISNKICGLINGVISQKLSMGIGDMYQAPWGSFAELFISDTPITLTQKKVGKVTVPK